MKENVFDTVSKDECNHYSRCIVCRSSSTVGKTSCPLGIKLWDQFFELWAAEHLRGPS